MSGIWWELAAPSRRISVAVCVGEQRNAQEGRRLIIYKLFGALRKWAAVSDRRYTLKRQRSLRELRSSFHLGLRVENGQDREVGKRHAGSVRARSALAIFFALKGS
jgi:hypothetical protein